MRLGGPVSGTWETPEQWAALVRDHGYGAAKCPLDETADQATIAAFARAAAAAGIVIAEVGAWSNPLSKDPQIAGAALTLCQRRLARQTPLAPDAVSISRGHGASAGMDQTLTISLRTPSR